jgi:branched-chain amino acid transport system ATP-binding protein
VTPVLEAQGLSGGYGPMRVIDDVSFSVDAGERVGILGLNGHGKTTLLRSVVGLVDWRRGDVSFFGESTISLSPWRLVHRGVVFIPQGDALFPGLSVRENLDAGAFAGKSWKARRQRRDRVIEYFPKLGRRLGQAAGTLSGGERRMLSIGRGLMTEARIYIIDEPSLGLAPSIGQSLFNTLMSLDVGDGAMLVAEQNRSLLEGRTTRMLKIHGGRFVPADAP